NIGQVVGVQAQGPVERLRVSGIVKFGSVSTIGGATLSGFDLLTAQHLFGKPGKLDEIAVAAAQGVSDPKLIASIENVLPADTQVRTARAQSHEDAKETDSFMSFLQKFLLGFGGVALFVGSFVIANSLSITIAQRTREFATLRTLGASRGQVLRSVMLEALVMGSLASIVGLFAGLALAKGLFSLFDAVGFTLPNNGLTLETRTIVVALLVCFGVALLSVRLVGPFAWTLGWPATKIGRAAGALARDNARRNPQRTASTASALMIGLALVTLVSMLAAGIVSSFRGAVKDIWRSADYAITAQNNFNPIPIAASQAIATAPGVIAVANVRAGESLAFGHKIAITAVDPPSR